MKTSQNIVYVQSCTLLLFLCQNYVLFGCIELLQSKTMRERTQKVVKGHTTVVNYPRLKQNIFNTIFCY